MSDFRQDFLKFALEQQVLKFGEFTTKAGRLSPYFFNAGLFNDGAGTLALAKFYAEEFETADKDIVQAVKGTGASWLQTLQYGLFTQSKPQIVAFTIYRLEMNFRDATVLGIVGAGGIGTYILMYTQSFQYDRVAVLLVVIGVVVFLLDQISFWVRKWVG